MKTFGRIVSGIALAYALNFGHDISRAQVKVSTETSTANCKTATGRTIGAPLQRLLVETEPVTFKYDKTTSFNSADPADVGALFLNDIFSKDSTTVGAYVINVGNLDRKDEQFFGTFITKKYDDITATLEIGKGARQTGPSREYIIGYFRDPTFSGDAAYFAQGSTFGHELIKYYFWGAYHDENAYIGAGKENARDLEFLGLKGLKDLGSFTFAIHDGSNGNIWIKSQNAYGNVNPDFYCTNMFDIAANYFTLPAFFAKHFSPASTKGNLVAKFEYHNYPSTHTADFEAMAATNLTPIQLGVGINTGYANGKSVSDFVAEAYKEFSIKGVKVSAEIRRNTRINSTDGYLILKYGL